MEIKKEIPSFFRLEKLARRWSSMSYEQITESDVLQIAIDKNLAVYVFSAGVRSVMLRSRGSILAGKAPIAIPAYIDAQFIKISEYQIQSVLYGNTIEISLLWLNEHELKLIQGEVPFKLSEIEAVVVDEKERLTITPDDIKFLAVKGEDAIKFERFELTEADKPEADKRINAFNAAVENKKIDLKHDTLNKMHITLKSLDSDLWPKSFEGFKDWREKYLPNMKLKQGRKRRPIR